MDLDDLGTRLCILGPSNSGKSTLADAIAAARGLPAIHLDRLHHRPFTDWQPRPAVEFAALHDAALTGERWVMDGNYTWLLPQRLARATGLILLDASTALSLARYVRRCWSGRDRVGGLEGGRNRVNWAMIRHIAITTRANRLRDAARFDGIDVPKIVLRTTRELDRFYRRERLQRR